MSSRCAWVWYYYVTESHADDFVIKKRCYLCWTLYPLSWIDRGEHKTKGRDWWKWEERTLTCVKCSEKALVWRGNIWTKSWDRQSWRSLGKKQPRQKRQKMPGPWGTNVHGVFNEQQGSNVVLSEWTTGGTTEGKGSRAGVNKEKPLRERLQLSRRERTGLEHTGR